MTHSVQTTVTNELYNNQKFILYKHAEDGLTPMSETEANSVKEILESYPSIFSDTEVVPKKQSEIKLLDPKSEETAEKPLDFEFENVQDDCIGIIDRLSDAIKGRVSGIDRDYTVAETFKND